jgi:hypothetical protein
MILPFVNLKRYLLPRRTRLILKGRPKEGQTLQDVLLRYTCIDCMYGTLDPQAMINHQKEWHGWGCFWGRLKDS